MSAADSDFTTITHGTPYAAISPSRNELSQKGNTVLITGSSSGIGFAIAASFAQANASKVILTGRRQEALDEAVQQLSHDHPQTRFVSYPVDICDTASVEELWNQLEEKKEMVHVLVLNACKLQKAGDIIGLGYQEMWSGLVGNVGSHMLFAEKFYNQKERQEKQKLVSLFSSQCTCWTHRCCTGACQRFVCRDSPFRSRRTSARLCYSQECGDSFAAANCGRCWSRRYADCELSPWCDFYVRGPRRWLRQDCDELG